MAGDGHWHKSLRNYWFTYDKDKQLQADFEIHFMRHVSLVQNIFPPYGSSAIFRVMDSPFEVSRSHSDTPQSVWLLWLSDQPVAQTSTWQKNDAH